MAKRLSDKERRLMVLLRVRPYLRIRALATAAGFSGPSHVHYYLTKLGRRGLVERPRGVQRPYSVNPAIATGTVDGQPWVGECFEPKRD